MAKRSHQKLASIMATRTIAAAIVVAFLMSIAGFLYNQYNLTERYNRSILELAHTSLPSINMAMYSFNNDFLHEISRGLIQHSTVSSAVVSDINEVPQAHASLKTQCVQPQNTAFPIYASIKPYYIFELEYKNTQLGKLILTPDMCNLTKEQNEIILQLALFSVFFSLSIAIFVFYLFHKRVTSPLNNLVNFIDGIDKSTLFSQDLTALQSDRDDEIGIATNQFAGILALLKQEISRAQKNEESIQAYSYRLEALISKKSSALESIKNSAFNLPKPSNTLDDLQLILKNISLAFDKPNALLKTFIQQENHQQALLLLEQIIRLNKHLELLSRDTSHFSSDLISPSYLSDATNEIVGNANISLINEVKKSVFSSKPFLISVLKNVVDNALFLSGHNNFLIHFHLDEHWLRVDISSKHFKFDKDILHELTMPEEVLGTDLTNIAGLGLTALVLKHLGGKIEIKHFNLEGQSICCYFPCSPKDQLQKKLAAGLQDAPLAILLDYKQCNKNVISYLNTWDLPYSTALSSSEQLLVTDQTAHQHPPKKTLYLYDHVKDGKCFSEEEFIQQLSQLVFKNSYQDVVRKARVLIVDSSKINIDHLQQHLAPLDVETRTATDGVEAVKLAQSEEFQLIFMSCKLPLMNGMVATQRIRQNSLNKQTPIVALTGYYKTDEQKQCLLSGMNDFITKPFESEQVKACLNQWIEGFAPLRQDNSRV